jgi:hypothetical protein
VVVALVFLLGGQTASPDVNEKPLSPGDQRIAPVPPPIIKPETILPKYVPPSAVDPAVAAFVDRRSNDRVSGDITSRIPRIKNPKDMAAVISVMLNLDEDDAVRNEAANLLRRSDCADLTDALTKVLDNTEDNDRFRSFAVQHLWQNVTSGRSGGRARVAARLREALADRSVAVKREALLALVRLGDSKGRETTERWLRAADADGLRDAAIRCAYDLGLREHIYSIRKHLKDENEVVRIAAIVALSQWGDRRSRPAFEEAAKSESVRLRRCGEAALKRLAGAARTP